MATPKSKETPEPEYVVLGINDYRRLVSGIGNAPIARVLSDPWIEILSGHVAPLPAHMARGVELSVLRLGGTLQKADPPKTARKVAAATPAKKTKRRAR